MNICLLVSLGVALLAAGAIGAEPLRLHPGNPHYLLFRGKPTVLIGSGEHYGAVLNLDFDYVRYLDAIAAAGMNLTRTFSGSYREVPGSFGITDNTLGPKRYQSPWARGDTPGSWDGGNKFDLTKFDPAHLARLKDFLAQAGKRGIVVELSLFCPFYEEPLWQANPMNAHNNVNNIGAMPRTDVYTLKHPEMLAIHEAMVRHIVGELKDVDNLYYEICNEPYFGGVTIKWQDKIASIIADVEKDFPHKHLIAQNIANKGAKIDKPNPLVSIFNFHYATPPETVAQNWAIGKVLGDDETGFRGKEDVYYRTEAWDFLMAGGATYSNLDYSFTPGHPDGSLKDFASPGGGGVELRKQLMILKGFLEGFDFIHMAPANAIVKGGQVSTNLSGTPASSKPVTARVLAESGKAYAIYVYGGKQIELSVELPAGSYSAEWLNTKTGQIDKREAFEHVGGIRKIASPAYDEDVACAIRATKP